jgi:transposase-like protein
MIESDCKIPTDFQPIAQPECYTLHGIPLAVQQMLDKGYTRWEIHKKLRISEDDWRDAIFEIRKQEAIMGKRLSEEKRAQIIALRESGKSYEEIAEACEVSRNAAYHAVKAAGLVGQADEPTAEPVTVCAPPDVVRKAVLYRIADIDDECSAAEAKINALREKIHELTKERGELEIWMEEVKRDESD